MHNPQETALELAEKLASGNRHVVFLIGAGASCAAGLPDLLGLKIAVGKALEVHDRNIYERLGESRNIEQILSRLRLVAEVLADTSDNLDGFTAKTASTLDKTICSKIAAVILNTPTEQSAHMRLATWAGLSRYTKPIEIFTTNYDLLLELSLENAGVPYFDGFIGTYNGNFRADLVEGGEGPGELAPPSRWIRVWKLHGSVSWTVDKTTSPAVIKRRGEQAISDTSNILAIYPSLQKYEESRRIPFVVLADRFRRALATPETITIVTGYSFGDQHLNELLYDAARLYGGSEVVALFHSDIPAEATERAKIIPNLTLLGSSRAVIGSVESGWAEHKENTAFWKGKAFTLGDFASFSNFLLLNVRSKTEPLVTKSEGHERE